MYLFIPLHLLQFSANLFKLWEAIYSLKIQTISLQPIFLTHFAKTNISQVKGRPKD